MVLQHHLQNVEAATEDTTGKRPQYGSPLLVDGHIINDLDELRRDAEEGRLVEAVLHKLAEHLQCAMKLAIGSNWYQLQQVVEQVGPLVWVVRVCDLADDESRRRLELAVELIRSRKRQELLPYQRLVLFADQ